MKLGSLSGLLALLLAIGLNACAAPSLVSFPFDPGGRGLNSLYGEMRPRIAGHYLVYASDRRGSQDIFLFDIDLRSLVDLPGLNAIDQIASSPAISADGRYLVFAGSRAGRSDIFLYDRDLRQLRNLTETVAAEVRRPTISADGNTIAFEISTHGQWDLMLYNRAGEPLEIPGFSQ